MVGINYRQVWIEDCFARPLGQPCTFRRLDASKSCRLSRFCHRTTLGEFRAHVARPAQSGDCPGRFVRLLADVGRFGVLPGGGEKWLSSPTNPTMGANFQGTAPATRPGIRTPMMPFVELAP